MIDGHPLACLLAEGCKERHLALSSTHASLYSLIAGQSFDYGQRLLLIDIDAAGL